MKRSRKQKILKAVRNSFPIYMCIGFILLILTGVMCFNGVKEFFVNKVSVTSVAIVNKTTSSVNVYWKSSKDIASQYLSYKEEYTLGTYKKLDNVTEVGIDSESGEHIYYIMIPGLKDDTKYVIKMSTNVIADKEYAFSTPKS